MGKDDLGDVAEAWFDRYLRECNYTATIITGDQGIRNPDRMVTSPDGHQIVCEIKSFATLGLLKQVRFRDGEGGTKISQIITRTQKQALQPIRRKITEAAEQLRRYKDDGVPLMVVLANPMGCPIPLEESSVIAAMYGDIDAVFEITEPDNDAEGASWLQAGRNGKLTNDHQYISAVAILRERAHSKDWAEAWFDENRPRFERAQDLTAAFLKAAKGGDVPQGSDVFLSVIETVSAEAVPLARDLFNGPLDRRYGATPDRDGLMLLDRG